MRQLALLAIAAALLLSGCAAGGGELDATVRAVAPQATTRGPPPATAPPGAGSANNPGSGAGATRLTLRVNGSIPGPARLARRR